MKRIGFVGWRGMVGSVLMARMIEENDFVNIDPVFFTTSQLGEEGPDVGKPTSNLQDAYEISCLKEMDIVVSCQGSDYTKRVFPSLRGSGWDGAWIDSASVLRMRDDSIIVLDPVNQNIIDKALDQGVRNFIGGNCTVSLMLMAIGSLLQQNLVEWVSVMTYQAASGAGARSMGELISQMGYIKTAASADQIDLVSSILEIDKKVTEALRSSGFPRSQFGVPLAGSLIPWIGGEIDRGQSCEEWKGQAETHRIMGNQQGYVAIDGICVRIGAMRSHCQALTIKLRNDIPISDIENMITESCEWVSVVPNQRDETISKLSPAAVSGTLSIPVGRLRKMNMGAEYLSAFIVGDQLLWGAAEPLRRMISMLI
ncbi:MAG: aspartate-semialdehyde dehydrogenase [Candidatus Endonucleobacter bathymodioli]|uniref:Aspartate-semialdehyde dehydrogenase n=1 Tax=Candidatus Endonucleibacter bathymodioli TaxID=539814 RepID=A0AA90P0T9_9GAMM|nr:aspartate-semialdehyde dehydrogenase [Candidatus Endonucleobacter bathymodioli]